ncbi:MAG TPA: hypothetical protein VKE41_01555 [Roseiflexaceae bacterium]|nr:hypothetical protein [Roseiflexaceae bacterium]
MHIFRRTLTILAAALIVVGITFSLAQSSYAQSLTPARQARSSALQSQSATDTINTATANASGTLDRTAQAGGFEREGNRSPSLFGAVDILKNLVIVGIIVALVALTKRVRCGRRPKGGNNRPKAPPAATPAV